VEVCCSLFGDTVNTAARMEGSSETMRIHLSYESYRLLQVRSWTMEGGGVESGFSLSLMGEAGVSDCARREWVTITAELHQRVQPVRTR
jgi:hypothetical protein